MLKVKECKDAKICSEVAKKFGAPYTELDRAFMLYDDALVIGIGVLGLDKGVVVIKYISDCAGAMQFDLLARSVLFFIKDFNPIMVRADCCAKYFLGFGFTMRGDKPFINSSDIKFVCMGE